MISFCPTLQPTYQEFRHFQTYVNRIQAQYSPHYAMVKIVPPPEWPSKANNWQQILKSIKIRNPQYQSLKGNQDHYYFQCKNQTVKKLIPLASFQLHAQHKDEEKADIKDIQQLQQKFWENLHSLKKQLYCANVNRTLMDSSSGQWDFSNLNSMFRKAISQPLKGLNSPFLFIGAWKTFFNWHIQELALSAINILHSGAVKVWYGIHPKDQKQFQKISGQIFPKQAKKCPLFMRHKSSYINPYKLLQKYPSLRITKMFQGQNEISIAFSGGYHCGFNTGFNIAEAVNYSVDNWLKTFVNFESCKCEKRIGVIVENQEIISNLKKNRYYKKVQVQYKTELRTIEERAKKERQQDQEYQRIDKQEVYSQFLAHKTKKINKRKKFIWIQKFKRFFPHDYQQQKDIIETQIQCDKCKKWHRMGSSAADRGCQQSFECKDAGLSCIKRRVN